MQSISVYITSEDFAFYVKSATLVEELCLCLFLLRSGRNGKFAVLIEGRNTGEQQQLWQNIHRFTSKCTPENGHQQILLVSADMYINQSFLFFW